MSRKSLLAVFSLFLAVPSPAGQFTLDKVTYGTLPQPGAQAPASPPAVSIAVYSTDETFAFESQAKPAMEARIRDLNAAGITTLGGRVVEAGSDYSFVIEYLPTVKAGASMPPAVLVDTYRNGATYWIAREAEEAMKACAANFRAAKLAVLDSYVYDAGGDSAFAVDYLQKNLLRPTQEYEVKFETYTGGKFSFENQAEKAVPSYLAMFRQAGVPAIRGKAVARADGDYAVRVEYAVRTNRYGRRPQYSVARYDSRETFTFEKDALAAGKAALPKFSAAGVPPLSAVLRPVDRDYSYIVDFLVVNIYQPGGTVPSAAVQTFRSPETFAFDSEAEKAMREKAASFAAAGIAVIGSAVSGEIGNYTYTIDFIARAGQQGPAYPAPPRY